MESKRIRQTFIDFFVKNGHTHVPSSSLIPANDPTILFANAGMNQFKDVFLGKEKRAYTRAVTSQKCARAGGKHNDLENVGFTKRHLVFFEMLGNFSFGDYFKDEAIAFAWHFLTKEMGLPQEKLYVSIYKDDDESFEIWHKKMGVPAEKIYRLGEKDNFWQMGDIGPCGPCTEIHIDRGAAYGCATIEQCGPACDCDRFLELWNNVFMQYDRQSDGTLNKLKQTGVDTGMGLERLCSVMQNQDSVFDTDLFTPIRRKIEELTGKKYAEQPDLMKAAFNVVSEHTRSSSMLIADGCLPSNEGRGYVLRKIIRRAALFIHKLTDKHILPELSKVVVQEFGDIYPELKANAELIAKTLSLEVDKFSENLVRGQAILEKYFSQHQDTHILPGAEAFKLYDTYGFPIELVKVMAQERGFAVDLDGFDMEMIRQQDRSGKPTLDELDVLQLPDAMKTEFTGYDEFSTTTSIIGLINHKNQLVDTIATDEMCWLITKQSPFFVMGGGQSPDKGSVTLHKTTIEVDEVRQIGGAIALLIKTPTAIKIGDTVTATVDADNRRAIMRNHTATHLLQAALMELFDKNIKQSGSFVAADYLRFDFSCLESPSQEILAKVERLVNQKIEENIPVCIEYTTMAEAKKQGALAFFEEKYNHNNLRIVKVTGYSAELCCGTHVRATGDIGVFKITELKAISAGNRRIVAVTGMEAVKLFQEFHDEIRTLCDEYKVGRDKLLEAIKDQRCQFKELQSTLKQTKKELLRSKFASWETQKEMVGEVPFWHIQEPHLNHCELKEIAEQLAQKNPGFYFLTSNLQDKIIFVAYTTRHYADKLNLKNFGAWLKETQGFNGGGSQTSIQGSGDKFDATTISNIKKWIKEN